MPPDAMGAAGPTQFLVVVNGRIRTFNKNTGTPDGALDTTTNSFFASMLFGKSVSDPRVRYDRLSGRWFVTMVTFDPGAGALQPANFVFLAVSGGSVISSASSFTFFAFQQDAVSPQGNDAGCFMDFDTLGLDVNALYIGGNFFCSNGRESIYKDSSEFVVRKSSILGAGPIVVTVFRNLTNGITAGPFTPQGADNDDPTATTGYVIGVDVGSFGKLELRRITDPGGTPSVSTNIDIPIQLTTLPIAVPHLNNDGRNLDAIDDRLGNAIVRNGTIWTVQNIQVDANGLASTTGGRDGSRWYQIRNLDATPNVLHSGTIFDTSTTNPLSYWMPSVNVSAQGDVAIGGSLAGAAHFVDAWTASMTAADLGSMESPVPYTSSNAAYNPVFSFPDSPHRWGDFSFTSLDPDDGMTIWTIQEYTNAANSWGVQAGKLLAPAPPTPASTTPSSVPAGLTSIHVTVGATNTLGSAYFDPGPGYAKRITASVGGGVVVNGVRVITSHSVDLDLDTSRAAVGSQDVTITNPDGQSATGVGVLGITPAAGHLRVTTIPALPSQIVIDGLLRDSWGLNWLDLQPGSYTVSFTHVEGYTEPAPQTVTVSAGATTTLAGNFTQRGSLRVITNPAVPAAISVDGSPRNDWGMWTDLPVGSHQVCFGPTANFTAPGCQTVSVTAGNLTQVTGNYTSSPGAPGPSGTGQLRVTTSPALPSQILLNGVPMDSWGLNWVDLAPGSYTLSFTHVEGYTEPSPQTAVVTAGATTVVQGSFTQRGSLRVITSPAEPANISVDFVPRDNWGVWTDIPTGSRTVCFGFLSHLVAPPCQTVTVNPGMLTTVTGTYTPGP